MSVAETCLTCGLRACFEVFLPSGKAVYLCLHDSRKVLPILEAKYQDLVIFEFEVA